MPKATRKPVPAVGVFQEPDTVHLLHSDLREALAQLASVIVGQNDALLAEVKALRAEVQALRPAAAEAEAPAPAETPAPAAELEPAAAEVTKPKRRSFDDNANIREAAAAHTLARRRVQELQQKLADAKNPREVSALVKRITEADRERLQWLRAYRQLRDAAIAANP